MEEKNDTKYVSEMITVVTADYKEQLVEEYNGNPLIEALPDILSDEETVQLISNLPPCTDKESEAESNIRFHYIERLFRYFQPWDVHLEIEHKISRAIRQGYLSRNPLIPNYASDLVSINKAIMKKDPYMRNFIMSPKTASGLTIIGFSGMGKTTAIAKILSTYPQVIIHSDFNKADFSHYQLVWLKLDCPFDGSVKGLCTNFFMEIDRIFDDNTYEKFAAGRNTTVDTMIPRMAMIARRHSLGVLVIDEVQCLSAARSGGSEKMLNFFVTLVNTIGIPVILIGTPKALSVLQSEFRQARRGSGQQGDIIWENMKKDDTWDLLIEGLFLFQWTRKKAEYCQELSDELYEQSQGIVDIAIKLFAMAQMRAIATGTEIINVEIIRQVAKDSLQLVKPMLDALKSGDARRIEKFTDIKPIDWENFKENQLRLLKLNDTIKLKKQRDKQLRVKEVELAIIELIEQFDINPEQAKKHAKSASEQISDAAANIIVREALKTILQEKNNETAKPITKDNINRTGKSVSTGKKIEIIKDINDLREIVSEGSKKNQSAYDSLKLKGYIMDPVEEFIMIG